MFSVVGTILELGEGRAPVHATPVDVSEKVRSLRWRLGAGGVRCREWTVWVCDERACAFLSSSRHFLSKYMP